jgi:hypothetical protein
VITECQRWREGSSCMRPAREIVSTRNLEVIEVDDDATPKTFIERHHYSRTYPAAQRRIGLVQGGEIAGWAIFSRPFRAETLTNAFPLLDAEEATELGRFVLLDEVGANAETWFLARAFELIRDQFRGVVSFSDPEPRTTVDGEQIFPGHYGCIYQAANANYRGLTEPKTKRILPDGTEFSNFASGKIRRGLTGWRSAVGELVRFGAKPLTSIDDKRERIAWLKYWRGRLTRPMRHHGQHRYTFALDRAMPKTYGPARAYPKRRAA